VAALGIAVDMIGAVLLVHHRFGFFMNWTGQQKGEGFEYHLLAIVVGIVLLARGSGAFSVDRALSSTAQ
jgi:putative oxidoreductase